MVHAYQEGLQPTEAPVIPEASTAPVIPERS